MLLHPIGVRKLCSHGSKFWQRKEVFKCPLFLLVTVLQDSNSLERTR